MRHSGLWFTKKNTKRKDLIQKFLIVLSVCEPPTMTFICWVYLRFKDNCTVKIWGWNRFKSHTARAFHYRYRDTNAPYPTKWKIVIEKWTRLCTSCRNNAIHIQPNRVRNWIFSSQYSRAERKPARQHFICGRNTLVWIFYGLQENDGTVNCIVRRSKLQTKEHFKWNSIGTFDKWCVSVFLPFDLPCTKTRASSAEAARSREIFFKSGKAYTMEKKTSLKIIVFLNNFFFFWDVDVFHSFICLKVAVTVNANDSEQAW